MDITLILLVCAALFPAVALCIYIYKKDRTEKEPLGLLLALLGLGAVICFPAAILEELFTPGIDRFFANFVTYVDGTPTLPSFLYHLYHLSYNTLGIALVEEGLKFLVLVLVTHKNKNFNSMFDGMIYAVFVSLGFAGLENLLYVLEYGFGNALVRAVLSVPGHMFFSVMMGWYYSYWHLKALAAKKEQQFIDQGIIKSYSPLFNTRTDKVLCFVVPVLFHGFYDYCCTVDTWFSIVLLLGFVIFMYIYCFGKVRKLSRQDGNLENFAAVLLVNQHPSLKELCLRVASQQDPQV